MAPSTMEQAPEEVVRKQDQASSSLSTSGAVSVADEEGVAGSNSGAGVDVIRDDAIAAGGGGGGAVSNGGTSYSGFCNCSYLLLLLYW